MDTLGAFFRVTLFGESHGPVVGAVIDGVLPGLPIAAEDFTEIIARRKTGGGRCGVSEREEDDIPEILSGVYDGCTTGAPIALIFRNKGQKSEDYAIFERIQRPGHADFTASVKYNYFNDPRGGGHFSGRLTLPLAAAGVIASKVIDSLCVPVQPQGDSAQLQCARYCTIRAEVTEIGGEKSHEGMEKAIEESLASGDSVGGIVECRVTGIPAGLGEPFFDSVESLISHVVFAIPGIRGIEFGDGFNAARMRGSEHNDPFIDSLGHTSRNGAGGINGGITNGNEICFRVAVKPASSIRRPQETFDFVEERMATLEIPGRHDACIALRVPPVLESVTAIVLADLMMCRKCRG
mgnify:CR=1 FL=1